MGLCRQRLSRRRLYHSTSPATEVGSLKLILAQATISTSALGEASAHYLAPVASPKKEVPRALKKFFRGVAGKPF